MRLIHNHLPPAMRKYSIAIAAIIFGFQALAQNCTQKLVQAERDYEAGRLAGIPNSIGACLADKDGFSKEERIRAYRLLTLVHIFTDNEPASETAVVNLLKEDPEHILDESTDPAELFYLYDQFQTKPIFRIGVRLGANTTFPSVMETFTSSDLNGEERKFYNGRGNSPDENTDLKGGLPVGFTGEVTFEKHLGKGFEVVGGVQARLSSYTVDNFFNNVGAVFNNALTHNQTYLRLPVYGRYTYNYNRRTGIKPYILAGVSGDYLLAAKYVNASRNGGTPFTLSNAQQEDDLKTFDQVNETNISIFGGIGVMIPSATHFLTLEARFDNSLFNYIKAENRYANQSVNFDLGHVEDNLTLNLVTFTVGYTRSIYNPKKKEK